MPTYEYACSTCGNQWEAVQRITEPPIDVCPKCASKSAQRLISAANFILKGGGWYADLYSSPKPASKAGEGASEGAAEGKTNGKSVPPPATEAPSAAGGDTAKPAASTPSTPPSSSSSSS